MKRKSTRDNIITEGSDNVFVDLGFGEESAELLVKSQLTWQLHLRIKALKLTQVKAAERLGISQPDVSRLMSAKFGGFSVAKLLAMLNALNVDVDIVVRPRTVRARRPGQTRVESIPA